ncbi:hypothetical protein HDV05_003143 [Chytridiales sp. JEL 0842]|nr:hypothetical protein HDV05_003143 [Chytridiales sp. JEL 0842]
MGRRNKYPKKPSAADAVSSFLEAQELAANYATMMSLRGEIPDPDLKRESVDPSLVTPQNADTLRRSWAVGMDFDPSKLTPLQDIFFYGDKNGVDSLVKNEQFAEMLETLPRASKMNFHVLHLIVQGARQLAGSSDHLYVLKKVLQHYKGSLDVRDAVGNTPLFHATGLGCTKVTLQMAEMLLKAGASVNARNRFGSICLNECVTRGDAAPIKLLTQYNIDATIPDYDGMTALKLAQHRPAIYQLIEGARRKAAATVEDSLKSCCNDDCKSEAWTANARIGRFTNKKTELVDAKLVGMMETLPAEIRSQMGPNAVMESMPFVPSNQSEKPLIGSIRSVKIQYSGGTSALMVYDRKRAFQKFILSSDPSYSKIVSLIKTKGVSGSKAYFIAKTDRVQTENILSVKVDDVLPPLSW